MAKKNNTDYRDGGLEFAKRIEIHLSSGGLTLEAFQHELAAWNNDQYEETKTAKQIETADVASNTAQVREFRKELALVPDAVKTVKEALASIGLQAVPLKQ